MACAAKILWMFFATVGSLIYGCNSQGCLERWFEFCSGTGGTNEVCACVLRNTPSPEEDLQPVDYIHCRELNDNASECCSNILNRLLQFYQPVSPLGDIHCIDDLVFCDLANADATEALDSGYQYIVPAFTFSCDGCMEEIVLLVELLGNTGETQPLAGEMLQIHLWTAYQSTTKQDEFLYKQRLVSAITVEGNNTSIELHQNQSKVTIPVSESERVCFQSGDVFGFSQPDGSNLKIIFSTGPSSDGTAYRIRQQTMPVCGDLQGFFELSDESEFGIPQLALKIVPEPTITTVLPMPVPSIATQTTPSDSGSSTPLREHQTSTHMLPQTTSIQFKSVATEDPAGGVTRTSLPVVTEYPTGGVKSTGLPSSAPQQEEKESDLIIIVAASAGGAAVFLIVLVVVIAILVVCMVKRHSMKKPRFTYEPNALGSFPLSDGRYFTGDTDSLVSFKQESLTGATPDKEPQQTTYDFPAELGHHPWSENMNLNKHDNQDIVNSPDTVHSSFYSGKYMNTQQASDVSKDGSGKAPESKSQDEINRSTNRESTVGAYKYYNLSMNYDDPRELSATIPPAAHPQSYDPQAKVAQRAHYTVPRVAERYQPPVSHVYRVLENPAEIRRNRTISHNRDLITSETSGGEKHQYHILEKGGSLPSRTKRPRRGAEGSTQSYSMGRRKPSKLAIATSLQETPSHLQVIDCGIYVPNTEERQRLTARKGTDAQGVPRDPYATWTKVKRTESTRRRGFFEESGSFWKPATDAAKLYDQFAEKKFREILRDQILIVDHLGAGQFGSVNKAIWKSPAYPKPLEVAVKTMKPSEEKPARVVFLQEAAIMGQFFHPNVVKLHGVVTVGEPAMIVLELMQNGALNAYLRKNAHKPLALTPTVLLSFSRQTASGMKYLANKKYVHRDLAARNILLSETLVCKISDFGMSRGLDEDSSYYMSKGGQVPIKWTAPEALLYKKYSSASDVYSYGMLMFEIWSLGLRPLSEVPFQQVVSRVSKGYCQAPPPGTPRAIYRLMAQCWNPSYNDRPTFSDITDYLGAPDESLLAWSSKDKAVSSGAAELGRPLDEGRNLYPDLQHCYDSGDVAV